MKKHALLLCMTLLVSGAYAGDIPGPFSLESSGGTTVTEVDRSKSTETVKVTFGEGLKSSYASRSMFMIYTSAKAAEHLGKERFILLGGSPVSRVETVYVIGFPEDKKIPMLWKLKYGEAAVPEMILDTKEAVNSLGKMFGEKPAAGPAVNAAAGGEPNVAPVTGSLEAPKS